MSLVIRKAEEEDLQAVLDILGQPDVDNGAGLSLPEAKRIFGRMQQYPSYTLFVAVEGGAVVGAYCLLVMDNLPHKGCPSSVIENVAVSPDRQRQGIGRAMMEHAIQKSRAAGCYKVTLSSDLKRIGAHRLYDSLEFDRHGYSFRLAVEH